jgi:hypothetical protein
VYHQPLPTDALPEIYRPLVEQLLPGPLPVETRATCASCAMCIEGPRQGPVQLSFDPQVKCCSYQPNLANFLVGGVLHGGGQPGRESVVARIARRDGVTPLGLRMTARYAAWYARAKVGFGQARELRCPHFVESPSGGECGIWAHRPSTCATYFCKHDRGARGDRFWLALKEWMATIESEVALWCAVELGAAEAAGPDEKRTDPLSRNEALGEVDPADYRRRWGAWEGRELDYFSRCAEKVRALDPPALLRVAGVRLEAASQRVRSRYQELDAPLPERLAVGRFQVIGAADGRLCVTTYSAYDPVWISARLLPTLSYFDGQPWARALEAIEAALGVRPNERLLRTLVDHEILVGA